MPRMSHSASSSWANSASQSFVACGAVSVALKPLLLRRTGSDEGCAFGVDGVNGCHAGKEATGRCNSNGSIIVAA